MTIANSYPATRTRQPSPPDFATTFGIIVKYHELWEPLVTLSNMANWTQFLRGYVTLFTIFLKNLELFLQHLNSENNSSVLFFTTIFWHWNCFLSLATTDDKDGHGLKLGKTGPALQVLMLSMPAKITKRKWIAIVSDMPFHSCFSGRILKKNLKPGSNVAEFNANEENIYCSHSFVSDSAHVKYIYDVWTGRKSRCAPGKHCICPCRHPPSAFLSWFSGRPQEDLEVPFILREPVLGWRVTLLAESLNLSERLYERKSRTPLPK